MNLQSLLYKVECLIVIICPNYLRQMSLFTDGEVAETERERQRERRGEKEENCSIHFKVNQYPR